jgi:hypothetical protein
MSWTTLVASSHCTLWSFTVRRRSCIDVGIFAIPSRHSLSPTEAAKKDALVWNMNSVSRSEHGSESNASVEGLRRLIKCAFKRWIEYGEMRESTYYLSRKRILEVLSGKVSEMHRRLVKGKDRP